MSGVLAQQPDQLGDDVPAAAALAGTPGPHPPHRDPAACLQEKAAIPPLGRTLRRFAAMVACVLRLVGVCRVVVGSHPAVVVPLCGAGLVVSFGRLEHRLTLIASHMPHHRGLAERLHTALAGVCMAVTAAMIIGLELV